MEKVIISGVEQVYERNSYAHKLEYNIQATVRHML